MKNLIHRPVSRHGMPYHGLVTDEALSTPGGDVTVLHTASVEGAIAFQLRNPIPDTRNATQIAADTANGWDLKDYALLCGWYRNVGAADAQLGELAWLYADENDVVWIIELVPTFYFSSPNYYYDIAVWRRDPFGRSRFGLDPRNLADELLTTLTLQVVGMDYRDGATVYTRTASQIGIGMSLKASSIVPSINGDVVYISILNSLTEVLEGTASYWELALRGVWATTTLTLSGSGALDGDGTGISAAFSSTLKYPDFITKAADIAADLAVVDPSPINHITTFDTSDCPTAPSGPGTCQESCAAVFTNDGVTFTGHTARGAWDDLPGQPALGDAESIIFKYHGASAVVDCKQTYYRWDNGEDYGVYLEGQAGGLSSAEMSSEQTLTAVEGPPGTWTWSGGPVTQVCSAWEANEGIGYLYNNVGVDINGNTDAITLEKKDDVGTRSILGVGTPVDCGCIAQTSTDGFPGAIGNYSNRTYTFSEPYTITDADTTAHCEVDQFCRLIIFPGIIGYVAAHGVPNGTTTYTQIRHRGKLWGIGADGTLTLITSWGPTIETGLTINFPWTSIAWEPVDKTFNVQTDGVTLVKYV